VRAGTTTLLHSSSARAIALLAAIIIFYIFETMKQRRANAKTYRKLPSQNKQIIDTIAETEKTGIIESATANIQDEPTRTWKARMTTTKSQDHKRLSMWKQIITRSSK
jgi:hypothetical protein